MYIVVKSNNKCNCTPQCQSLIKHWRKFNSKNASETCASTSCTNEASVGAVVKENGQGNHGLYVVPLCRSCANENEVEIDGRRPQVAL